VRQLWDGGNAKVTLARSYEPFGNTLTSVGSGNSIFNYTGEQRDLSNLVYLRARYLSIQTGRFISAAFGLHFN
jgi:RHS repeat-associated protein